MPKKSRHRKGFILRKKGTRKIRGGVVSNEDFTNNTTKAFESALVESNTVKNQSCKVAILSKISKSNAYINRLVYLSTKDLVLSMIREIRTPPFKELLKDAPPELTKLATEGAAPAAKGVAATGAEGVAVSLKSFIDNFDTKSSYSDVNLSSINKKNYKLLMERIKLVYEFFLTKQSPKKTLKGNNSSTEQNWGNIYTAIKAAEAGFAINDEKTITAIIGPIKATDDAKRNEALALPTIGGNITKEKVDDIKKMVDWQVYPFDHKNLGIRTIIGNFDEITINLFRLNLRLVQSLDNFIISEFTLLKHIAGLGTEPAAGLSTEPVAGSAGGRGAGGRGAGGRGLVVRGLVVRGRPGGRGAGGRGAGGRGAVSAAASENDESGDETGAVAAAASENDESGDGRDVGVRGAAAASDSDESEDEKDKVDSYKSSLINAMNAADTDERKRRATLKALISEFGVSEANSESFIEAIEDIEPNKENYNKELEKLKSELDSFIRKLTQSTNISSFSRKYKSLGKQTKSSVKDAFDVFKSSGKDLKNTIIALLSNKVRALFISNMNPTQSMETFIYLKSFPDDKFEINIKPNATDNEHIKELKECAYTVYIASGKNIILTRMALNRPKHSPKPPTGIPPVIHDN